MTILLIDVVDSTAIRSGLNDRGWRDLLGAHRAIVRANLERYGGREVRTAGDGFFVTFPGPFKDSAPIWKDELFPCRVRVRSVATLTTETAVPVFELRDELSVFRDLKNPNAWTGHFRGSPARWKPADGQAVVAAMLEARDNPISPFRGCGQARPSSPGPRGGNRTSNRARQ